MNNVIQLNYKGFSSQASYDEECQEWHGRIYLPNWGPDSQFFSGQNKWWVRREFKYVIDYYLEITQYWADQFTMTVNDFLDKYETIGNKDKGEQIMNSSTQPWIEVTFTEALDFYARQLRHANLVSHDQKPLNIEGMYATAVEFQNGSLLAVTAASSENYSVHRDDWADYGDAVPQFWVKDMGLRNN